MIGKFILIVVFAHGHGPRVNYANLGEFATMDACQRAAGAVKKASRELDLIGNIPPKLICAEKGQNHE